jgi:hypothetical protein
MFERRMKVGLVVLGLAGAKNFAFASPAGAVPGHERVQEQRHRGQEPDRL